MIELFENPENYPSAKELLDEIKTCKDPVEIPILVDKLTEIMKLGGSVDHGVGQKNTYIRKWAKKLEPLTTNEGVSVCAILLENQYKILTDIDRPYKEGKKKLDQLKESIADMPKNVREIVLNQVAIDADNLPKRHTDYFPYRGVNVYDEIVKAYDSCLAKELVGFQPVQGPVGLAYAIRFRSIVEKEKKTKQEIVDMHNNSSSFEPTNISTCDTFDDLPLKKLDHYRDLYNIEGDGIRQDDIGMTIEQKETRINTQKIKLGGKKFSYEDIQLHWDILVLSSILEECPVASCASNDEVQTKIIEHAEDIAHSTRMGPGNVVVSAIDIDIPEDMKHFKVEGDLAEILGNKIIIAHRGSNESHVGFVLSPYNPLIFSKAIGSEEIDPKRLLSRNGLVNIYGGENFYRVLEVV